MFTWNVEELKLRNENCKTYADKERIFNCESELTREEKIAFVDSMQNGKLSYILELVDKFNRDESTLPKDAYGKVKTISLKAWINRNDTKYGNTDYTRIIDSWYNYGKIHFLGCERWITWDDFENEKTYSSYDIYANYVDEIFHRQLKQCLKMENEYFRAHDEYEILKNKFRNKNYPTTFGVNIGMCSNGCIYVYDNDNDKKREITIDELKYLLAKYDELDKLVEKITKETKIKY